MARITEAGRTVAAGYVAFDIQWEGTLPVDVPVRWSMVVTGDDGTVRLGHERAGADVIQFVDDELSGRRTPVEPDADLAEGRITVRFPAEVVGVAVEWPVWKAALTVADEEPSTQVVDASG